MNIDKLTPELLGKVLGIEIYHLYEELGYIHYEYHKKGIGYINQDDINIYELMFRMKEYANKNKWVIRTEMHYPESINIAILKMYEGSGFIEPFNTLFKSEFEAVLKATSYIEENRDDLL